MGHAESEDDVPFFIAATTYFGYAVLIVLGYIRDFFGHVFKRHQYTSPKGYAPLLRDFEHFFTRRLYRRIEDCWNRPIASRPGAYIDVMERVRKERGSYVLRLTGNKLHCLNLGSYNYLGFGDDYQYCKDAVVQSVRQFGVSTTSPMGAAGYTTVHRDLEATVAEFVGKPAALILGMGFATNASTLPSLVGKGDLLISDSLNHSSLVMGSRQSGAKIKVFPHNDYDGLERLVRSSIAEGQPRTHRPWRRIVIIVEGIYSMEGDVVNLPRVVEIKEKYKCYLYVDEAHSIGCLGKTGRGVCDYWGVDPKRIDILMGTFTKSFGSCGGYVASSHELIEYLRARGGSVLQSTSMAPACAMQALSALRVIMGRDGTHNGEQRLKRLHDNSNYFRRRLVALGFQTFGYKDSPVMPVLLYNPAKIAAFSRECLKRGIAVVVVGFPATSIIKSRVRFCLSASHTKEDLDVALEKLSEVGDVVHVKYNRATSESVVYGADDE